MKPPSIASSQEWEAARRQLLVKEKDLTRARDGLAAERRRMPWLAVEKQYQFDGPNGRTSLCTERGHLSAITRIHSIGTTGRPQARTLRIY
jgi:predicted dithiol-disulfide oxidoreductase (DUF899 family)